MYSQYDDYRALLRDQLSERSQRNPKYSLRSFARDLGLSPARLSEILSGKSGLSRAAAIRVAKRLVLSREETELFCDLVESLHARSQVQRSLARRRLRERRPLPEYRELKDEVFRLVSDWQCFAILELMALGSFKSDTRWIADALGLRESVAAEAVERLLRLGLIDERAGSWVPTGPFSTHVDIPSEAIRSFNRQILDKAKAALGEQTVNERDFSTLTLAFDSRRLVEAKKAIEKFRREFDRRFGMEGAKDRVYCLAVQLFNLTHALSAK